MSRAPTGSGGVQAVRSALRLLEELALAQPVGVSDLARRLEMPKTSVHRILATLRESGWAEPHDRAGGGWRVSRRAFRVGLAGVGAPPLTERARVLLTELRDAYGETVHLTVPDFPTVLVVTRVDGTNSLRTFLELGTRAPMASSAAGRAVLSVSSPDLLEALLARPIERHTEVTLQDHEEVRRLVAQAREDGWAVNRGEWRSGIAAVAAPVVAAEGAVLGAVSLSMPAARLEELDIAAVGARVATMCRQLAAESWAGL